jgi:hypothetical protein
MSRENRPGTIAPQWVVSGISSSLQMRHTCSHFGSSNSRMPARGVGQFTDRRPTEWAHSISAIVASTSHEGTWAQPTCRPRGQPVDELNTRPHRVRDQVEGADRDHVSTRRALST